MKLHIEECQSCDNMRFGVKGAGGIEWSAWVVAHVGECQKDQDIKSHTMTRCPGCEEERQLRLAAGAVS